MKTCPVCHAVAFDDAAICFGCLHRYDEDSEASAPTMPLAPVEPAGPAGHAASSAPSFLVRFTPLLEPSGSLAWSCTVENT